MAAAVHKLLHHGHHSSSQNDPAPTSPHDHQNSAMDRAREDEKCSLAHWEDQKGQTGANPDDKRVGNSSPLLRQEDFELVKTLGTGAQIPIRTRGSDCSADSHARNLCARLASTIRRPATRRPAQGVCPQDPAQSRRYAVVLSRAPAAANGHVSVIRLKQVEHVRNERNVLAAVAGHPFITTMVSSFQDHDSLYMLVCAPSSGGYQC